MHVERRKKEFDPGAYGVLITLDHTPIFGTDLLQSLFQGFIYEAFQKIPTWYTPLKRGFGPVFRPRFDIHQSFASYLEGYIDARQLPNYPEVAVIAGGPVTELAWSFFWQETGCLESKKARDHRTIIVDYLRRSPPPDISCIALLSEEQVMSTAPQEGPAGWLLGLPEGKIFFLNHCFRRAIEKYGNLLPEKLILDFEKGECFGGNLAAQFQPFGDFISQKLHSHQPILRKTPDSG